MLEVGFGRDTVLSATGITYRQLDYWARTSLVTPSIADAHGSGNKRLYSFADMVKLRTIRNLLEAGVSLPKIRKALEYVRTELKRPLEEVTLASDGKTVYACASPTEVIDLLSGGQGVFAIAVDKVYKELQGRVAEFKRPPAEEQRVAEAASEAHSG